MGLEFQSSIERQFERIPTFERFQEKNRRKDKKKTLLGLKKLHLGFMVDESLGLGNGWLRHRDPGEDEIPAPDKKRVEFYFDEKLNLEQKFSVASLSKIKQPLLFDL